jgi:hypothetical protein
MTQPLDPHTLRQAAARWPRETLNTRAAQSFLRSLALEAATEQDDQPTAPDPLRAELAELLEHIGTREGHTQQIHADTVRALLTQYPAQPATPLAVRMEQLAQELSTVANAHHASVAGDAYADAADRIMAVLAGTYP